MGGLKEVMGASRWAATRPFAEGDSVGARQSEELSVHSRYSRQEEEPNEEEEVEEELAVQAGAGTVPASAEELSAAGTTTDLQESSGELHVAWSASPATFPCASEHSNASEAVNALKKNFADRIEWYCVSGEAVREGFKFSHERGSSIEPAVQEDIRMRTLAEQLLQATVPAVQEDIVPTEELRLFRRRAEGTVSAAQAGTTPAASAAATAPAAVNTPGTETVFHFVDFVEVLQESPQESLLEAVDTILERLEFLRVNPGATAPSRTPATSIEYGFLQATMPAVQEDIVPAEEPRLFRRRAEGTAPAAAITPEVVEERESFSEAGDAYEEEQKVHLRESVAACGTAPTNSAAATAPAAAITPEVVEERESFSEAGDAYEEEQKVHLRESVAACGTTPTNSAAATAPAAAITPEVLEESKGPRPQSSSFLASLGLTLFNFCKGSQR